MKPNKLPLGLFAATRAIAQGSLSPQDYLQQCIERADEREPALHAFVARTPTQDLLAVSYTHLTLPTNREV